MTVPSTGGWDNYREITAPVTKPDDNTHDLYIVFTGSARGALLDLDSYTFIGAGRRHAGRPTAPRTGPVRALGKCADVNAERDRRRHAGSRSGTATAAPTRPGRSAPTAPSGRSASAWTSSPAARPTARRSTSRTCNGTGAQQWVAGRQRQPAQPAVRPLPRHPRLQHHQRNPAADLRLQRDRRAELDPALIGRPAVPRPLHGRPPARSAARRAHRLRSARPAARRSPQSRRRPARRAADPGAGLLQDGRLPALFDPQRHRRDPGNSAPPTGSPSPRPRTPPSSPPPTSPSTRRWSGCPRPATCSTPPSRPRSSRTSRRRRLRRHPRRGRHRVRLAVVRRPGRRVLPLAPGQPAGDDPGRGPRQRLHLAPAADLVAHRRVVQLPDQPARPTPRC